MEQEKKKAFIHKNSYADLKQVEIQDPFWDSYQQLVAEKILPYQLRALKDEIPNAAPSHAIENLRIATGLDEGSFHGFIFQDSDVAKWLEALAYSLVHHPNPELEAAAEEIIDLLAQAQEDDGYLNTYFQLEAPEARFKNLADCHELYVAGHLIEAGVAFYRYHGEQKLLDIVTKFADYLVESFGPGEAQIAGYPGHEEIELALVKLDKIVPNRGYKELADFFVRHRGQEPEYFTEERQQEDFFDYYPGSKDQTPVLKYHQAHAPIQEQKRATGHAVRAVYYYTAVADLAYLSQDPDLIEAAHRLYDNITEKQMYITGGIGQSGILESFTTDYDLPNDANYSETCAAIGLALFAQRMSLLDPDRRYHELIERLLYNGILSGVSLDGERFFYVNPMQLEPENCLPHTRREHVKPTRQAWFPCACCPPNLARLIANLGSFIYTTTQEGSLETLSIHQLIGSVWHSAASKNQVTLSSKLPWEGEVQIDANLETDMVLRLRRPAYAREVTWSDGFAKPSLDDFGYYVFHLSPGEHHIELTFPLEIELYAAHENVSADAGKLCVQRGPIVYCAEGLDQDFNLFQGNLLLERDPKGLPRLTDAELLEETIEGQDFPGIQTTVAVYDYEDWPSGNLYQRYLPKIKKHTMKMIPYAYFANREESSMQVWFNYLIM